MTTLTYYSFEVTPVAPATFDPFILDVPSLSDDNHAARRAYWQAFHLLGARGIDIEEFTVREWKDNKPGRRVHTGGFVDDNAS